MEYTQNYHLPQWAEDDRILMPDFNAAMAAIESGLTTTQTAAGNALAGLGTGGENCRVTFGSYTGDGSSPWVTINTPFTPALAVVTTVGTGGQPGIMVKGSNAAPASAPSFTLQSVTWGDNFVRWEGGPNSGINYNAREQKYVYLVIGY